MPRGRNTERVSRQRWGPKSSAYFSGKASRPRNRRLQRLSNAILSLALPWKYSHLYVAFHTFLTHSVCIQYLWNPIERSQHIAVMWVVMEILSGTLSCSSFFPPRPASLAHRWPLRASTPTTPPSIYLPPSFFPLVDCVSTRRALCCQLLGFCAACLLCVIRRARSSSSVYRKRGTERQSASAAQGDKSLTCPSGGEHHTPADRFS